MVYTSDQGFFLGDHGWFDKRLMYEQSLGMPLVIRWPAEITAGCILRWVRAGVPLWGEPVFR